MGDEREEFLASPDERRSNRSEASRWSEDVIRQSHLDSDFQSVPLQYTDGADRMVNTSGDMDEAGIGVSTSTSTTNTQRAAQNGEKSVQNTVPAATSRRASKQRPHIFLNWWKELLACILFSGALLALFATVYAYHDRPSPSWPNWISLNTIISIYAILMEIGIVLVTAEGLGQLKWLWFGKESRPLVDLVKYDDATRGPMGAVRLLWRLRARDLLSSFGALIVILALGLSPFAQQVIRFYDCTILVNETARIPRTNYYAESGGFHIGAEQENIVPAVQRSVLAGIFNPSKVPDVTCSTGNCTWSSEYSTVGYCSACKDISDQLAVVNETYQYTESAFNHTETATSWNLTTAVLLSDGTYGVTVNQTNPAYGGNLDYAAMGIWYPPEGYKPTFGPFAQASHVPGVTLYLDFVIATNVNAHPGSNPINPGTAEPVPGCEDAVAKSTWPCRGYGGSRCTLYPCVKTFAASMAAGKLTETLKSTTANWGSMTMLDIQCLKPSEVRSLMNLGYNLNSGQRWLAYNATFQLDTWQSNTTFPESMMNRGCLYAVDDIFATSMYWFLMPLFNGTVSGGIPEPSVQAGFFLGPQVVQWFFNFGSADFDWVDQTFDNVTASLTNYIRQNGVANFSSPAVGKAKETKTCIDVRWPFLAYPAALAVLALTFFITMVFATRPTGHRPRVWKSSPLALLYHGLVGWEESTSNNVLIEDKKGMEKVAKSTAVKLDNTYDGVTHLEVKSRFVRK